MRPFQVRLLGIGRCMKPSVAGFHVSHDLPVYQFGGRTHSSCVWIVHDVHLEWLSRIPFLLHDRRHELKSVRRA